MKRAQRRKYHFIYKTTCTITGRYYIGMHSTDDMNDGYLGSGRFLRNSIKKHGLENHRREVIEICESREAVRKREEELVDGNLLDDELCMNLMKGGTGGWDDVREKKLNPCFHPGTDAYAQWKEALSRGARKAYKQGKLTGLHPNWTGRHHRQEVIEQIRRSKAGQGTGLNNSQSGTRWMITNDGTPVKVSAGDFETRLAEGWKPGRK